MSAELAIRDASVVDGTGRSAYSATVAVAGGRIVSIGRDDDAHTVIDAGGRVLAPGFIDMHTHSDLMLVERPVLDMKLAQGVTLEVLGQDGLACAPVTDDAVAYVADLIAPLDGETDEPWGWRSVAEFLARLDGACAQNVAYLVPHGTVRAVVVGADEREASSEELTRMAELVSAAMRDGAYGLSTGLSYPPAHASTTAEVVGLARAAAHAGGIYVTHLRSYGAELFGATDEALEIGRSARLPVHFSHFQAPGRRNHGRASELLGRLEAASAEGVDVTYDVYPYEAASTMLTAFLPPPIRFLPRREALDALRDAVFRREFVEAVDASEPTGMDVRWSDLRIANGLAAMGGGDGSLDDLRRRRGESLGETVATLLEVTECRASVVAASTRESDVTACLVHPRATVGSDGILVGERPHPRGFGTFPRFLRRATAAGLEFEAAVAAMTGRSAARLGLRDRGVIAAGAAADLCLFDPASFIDEATYDDPTRLARGMDLVLVNGTVVWSDGAATGATPGRALRSRATHAPVPAQT
jgi:N-acyl-D-amino-acid deacylase